MTVDTYSNMFVIGSTQGTIALFNGEYIPAWLATMISEESGAVTAPLSTEITDLHTQIDSSASSNSASISSITDDVVALSTYIDTTKIEMNGKITTNVNSIATKVTEAEAQAVVNALVAPQFLIGNQAAADTWVENMITAYATANLVDTQAADALTATVNDNSLQLTDIVTEAITVYKSSSGIYNTSIVYTPTVDREGLVTAEFTQGSDRNAITIDLSMNNLVLRTGSPVAGTLGSMSAHVVLTAGVSYTFDISTASEVGDMTCNLFMAVSKGW